MSIKVTVIGAGSVGFTRGMVRDILTVPLQYGDDRCVGHTLALGGIV